MLGATLLRLSMHATLLLCAFASLAASSISFPQITREDRHVAEDDISRFTTPIYRAPEQVDLYQDMPIDHRVDIWVSPLLLYNAPQLQCNPSHTHSLALSLSLSISVLVSFSNFFCWLYFVSGSRVALIKGDWMYSVHFGL